MLVYLHANNTEVHIMSEDESIKRKKPRTRSPSYPAINLDSAINKALIIKQKEGGGNYYLPLQVALGHWGYAPKSGNGLLAVAALKKFGLIEDKGSGKSREIKLTELARKILYYADSDENKNEYKMLLQEAALNPQIHKELWEMYDGNLPSDDTLRAYLLFNRPDGRFAESAVDDFIIQFRTTISLAKLGKNDIISGHGEDITNQAKEKKMEPMPNIQEDNQPLYIPSSIGTTGKQSINFPVKISDKLEANLLIQYPMDEKDLYNFLTALEALKPGILKSVLNKQNEKEEEN